MPGTSRPRIAASTRASSPSGGAACAATAITPRVAPAAASRNLVIGPIGGSFRYWRGTTSPPCPTDPRVRTARMRHGQAARAVELARPALEECPLSLVALELHP